VPLLLATKLVTLGWVVRAVSIGVAASVPRSEAAMRVQQSPASEAGH